MASEIICLARQHTNEQLSQCANEMVAHLTTQQQEAIQEVEYQVVVRLNAQQETFESILATQQRRIQNMIHHAQQLAITETRSRIETAQANAEQTAVMVSSQHTHNVNARIDKLVERLNDLAHHTTEMTADLSRQHTGSSDELQALKAELKSQKTMFTNLLKEFSKLKTELTATNRSTDAAHLNATVREDLRVIQENIDGLSAHKEETYSRMDEIDVKMNRAERIAAQQASALKEVARETARHNTERDARFNDIEAAVAKTQSGINDEAKLRVESSRRTASIEQEVRSDRETCRSLAADLGRLRNEASEMKEHIARLVDGSVDKTVVTKMIDDAIRAQSTQRSVTASVGQSGELHERIDKLDRAVQKQHEELVDLVDQLVDILAGLHMKGKVPQGTPSQILAALRNVVTAVPAKPMHDQRSLARTFSPVPQQPADELEQFMQNAQPAGLTTEALREHEKSTKPLMRDIDAMTVHTKRSKKSKSHISSSDSSSEDSVATDPEDKDSVSRSIRLTTNAEKKVPNEKRHLTLLLFANLEHSDFTSRWRDRLRKHVHSTFDADSVDRAISSLGHSLSMIKNAAAARDTLNFYSCLQIHQDNLKAALRVELRLRGAQPYIVDQTDHMFAKALRKKRKTPFDYEDLLDKMGRITTPKNFRSGVTRRSNNWRTPYQQATPLQTVPSFPTSANQANGTHANTTYPNNSYNQFRGRGRGRGSQFRYW